MQTKKSRGDLGVAVGWQSFLIGAYFIGYFIGCCVSCLSVDFCSVRGEGDKGWSWIEGTVGNVVVVHGWLFTEFYLT